MEDLLFSGLTNCNVGHFIMMIRILHLLFRLLLEIRGEEKKTDVISVPIVFVTLVLFADLVYVALVY